MFFWGGVRESGFFHIFRSSGKKTRNKKNPTTSIRHAFDGSGADNFFDAGSCVDGRLTSAWNWGSRIEKKSYYNLFKVAGFSSFDGKDWSE